MLGAFLLLCVAAVAIGVLPPGLRGTAYIAVHLLLTACMVLSWRCAQRDPTVVARVVRVGLIARAIAALSEPYTTHDPWRYLWDGAVLVHGLDPYIYSPQSPPVSALRGVFHVAPEHAAYPTLYPPLALASFALCATVGPAWGLWAWKALAAAASMGTVLVAQRVCRDVGSERHLPLVALSPILVLEAGVGAHVDTLASLFVALGLWAWQRGRDGGAGVAAACAALVKLWPAVLLWPLFWSRLRARPRAALALCAGATLTLCLGYGLPIAVGLRPYGSLDAFLRGWSFGSPSGVLLGLFGGPWASAALLSMALFVAARWAARGRSGAAVLLACCAPMLVSPVVFPWYLCALVVLLALWPSTFVLGWVTTAPLTYEVIDRFDTTGAWEPASWPLWAIAGGWAVGLWADSRRRRGAVVQEGAATDPETTVGGPVHSQE